MALFNRVLNVLIFLLAVGALFAGYLLFKKRIELRDRGNTLAVGVANMVTELDTNIGDEDKLAGKVTAEPNGGGTLGWRNFGKIADLVKEAKEHAAKVREQRDKLGVSYANLATDMDVPEKGPAENFQKLKTFEAETVKVSEHYKRIKTRDESLVEQLAKLGARVKAPMDTKKLNEVADASSYTGELTKLATQVETLVKRGERCGEALQSIAIKLGKEDLKEKILEGENADIKTVEEEISKLKEREAQLEKVKADLENLQKELDKQIAKTEEALANITTLETNVSNLQGTIEVQRSKITNLEAQIARTTNSGENRPEKDISGNVVEVNYDWNYVILDVGEEKGVKVGVPFLVARDREYICKVKVRKVYKSYAVADVLPELRRGQVLKGDRVFYYFLK